MNTDSVSGFAGPSLSVKICGLIFEGLSSERHRPDFDSGRQCVHHQLVCANDVHSLCLMRHSQRATAHGVPLL